MDILGSTFRIAARALRAERMRLDVVASNLANANTTQTPEGGPYRRKGVVFTTKEFANDMGPVDASLGAAGRPSGVDVSEITYDDDPPRLVYEPGHPDADPQGYVAYPNVNPVLEMVDLQAATRAYEANVQVVNATRQLSNAALSIIG